MNTVLIVLFVMVIASFITGACLTMWENKHGVKVVCNEVKPVVNKFMTNNIVISNDSIEVLEMEVESSFNDLSDAEII